jgi:hypothetical protein
MGTRVVMEVFSLGTTFGNEWKTLWKKSLSTMPLLINKPISEVFLVPFWYVNVKSEVREPTNFVATPLWGKCEVPFTLLKTQSAIARVKTPCIEVFFYTFGKVLKCRCPKWPCMSNFDICNISYGRKKGWESTWQFDSRPLKVRNRLNPGACK